MLNKNKEKNGFSLLGVMIAIFITIIGLTAILNLASYSLKAGSSSKMDLIAAGLAQEGIELVHSFRESYENWQDWYNDSSIIGDHRVQYDSSDFMPYAAEPLKYDSSSGFYQYNIGNNSAFSRMITLAKISDNEIRVTVRIDWQEGAVARSLAAEDRMWNWK